MSEKLALSTLVWLRVGSQSCGQGRRSIFRMGGGDKSKTIFKNVGAFRAKSRNIKLVCAIFFLFYVKFHGFVVAYGAL